MNNSVYRGQLVANQNISYMEKHKSATSRVSPLFRHKHLHVEIIISQKEFRLHRVSHAALTVMLITTHHIDD